MRRVIALLLVLGGLSLTPDVWAKAIIRVVRVYTGSLHKYDKIGFLYERIICSGNAPISCPVTVGAGAFYFPSSDNEYINNLSNQVIERLNNGEYEGRLVISYGNSSVPTDILLEVEQYAYMYLNGTDSAVKQIEQLLKGYVVGFAVWKYDPLSNKLEAIIIYNDGK